MLHHKTYILDYVTSQDVEACVCLLDTTVNRDTVWVVDFGGPRELCIRWGSGMYPQGKGQFWPPEMHCLCKEQMPEHQGAADLTKRQRIMSKVRFQNGLSDSPAGCGGDKCGGMWPSVFRKCRSEVRENIWSSVTNLKFWLYNTLKASMMRTVSRRADLRRAMQRMQRRISYFAQ